MRADLARRGRSRPFGTKKEHYSLLDSRRERASAAQPTWSQILPVRRQAYATRGIVDGPGCAALPRHLPKRMGGCRQVCKFFVTSPMTTPEQCAVFSRSFSSCQVINRLRRILNCRIESANRLTTACQDRCSNAKILRSPGQSSQADVGIVTPVHGAQPACRPPTSAAARHCSLFNFS
jgi:hypothetical protein